MCYTPTAACIACNNVTYWAWMVISSPDAAFHTVTVLIFCDRNGRKLCVQLIIFVAVLLKEPNEQIFSEIYILHPTPHSSARWAGVMRYCGLTWYATSAYCRARSRREKLPFWLHQTYSSWIIRSVAICDSSSGGSSVSIMPDLAQFLASVAKDRPARGQPRVCPAATQTA